MNKLKKEYERYLSMLRIQQPGVMVGEGPREIAFQIGICEDRISYIMERM